LSKINKIKQFLQIKNIEVAFISTPDNVFYVSGFSSNPHERILGVFIFKEAEPFLICPKMEVPDVLATNWPYKVVGYSDTENPWEIIQSEITKRIVNDVSIAIEKSHITVERFELLSNLFERSEFYQIDTLLNDMRVIKTEDEIENMRIAAQLADFAIGVGCREIKEGITELEVLMAIEFELKKKGVQKMSFDTMVLSGPKTASPHGTPGSRKIQQGDFILFDLGVIYNGYCSDITRTVAFGEPSIAMREIYETVKRAEQAAIDLVKPGVNAADLDNTAREIIKDAGYGVFFTHRLGHGLGISVHEYPSITATNDFILKEGMVFTIEPGIYHPEIAGVRIEDDVVVTNNGVEVLTKFPKELQIINPI